MKTTLGVILMAPVGRALIGAVVCEMTFFKKLKPITSRKERK